MCSITHKGETVAKVITCGHLNRNAFEVNVSVDQAVTVGTQDSLFPHSIGKHTSEDIFIFEVFWSGWLM